MVGVVGEGVSQGSAQCIAIIAGNKEGWGR